MVFLEEKTDGKPWVTQTKPLDLHINWVINLLWTEQLVALHLAIFNDGVIIFNFIESLLWLEGDNILVFDPIIDLSISLAQYFIVGVPILIALLKQDPQVINMMDALAAGQLYFFFEALHFSESTLDKIFWL